MKNYLDGGDAVLEAARKSNVDYVICSPGSEWSPVWEAFARQEQEGADGPAYIDCWHETLAVNMAEGYTVITGKPQMVLLHAGGGVLQGAMGIQGAFIHEIPMVLMSGETLTYGDRSDYEPGYQWIRQLSIIGGPHALVAPYTKWSNQVGSIQTLYETVARSFELSQRTPRGPIYLNVPLEVLNDPWTPPKQPRETPRPSKLHAADEDIEALATLFRDAALPAVFTDAAGRDADAFRALADFSAEFAVPVIESLGTAYANFPKDHPMYLGHDMAPMRDMTDLALLVRGRQPWYPAHDRPEAATIVSIDENPLKGQFVYQAMHADRYVEGDVATTLRKLTEAIKSIGPDAGKIAERRSRIEGLRAEREQKLTAAKAKAQSGDAIDPVLLFDTLNAVMPDDTIYIDEMTTHSRAFQDHMVWTEPHSYFSTAGGLGQGMGWALGIKLASRDRQVVLSIGDGGFLYNPIVQSLGAARDYDLPITIVICNNHRYAAMRGGYVRYYPDGAALSTGNDWRGVRINGPDYPKLAEAFDFVGITVSEPGALEAALEEARKANLEGKSAIVDVELSR